MRIIGEIDHPKMKITAFVMNEKVSIKFEDLQVEHIIKFRSGSAVNNMEDVQKFLTDDIIHEVYEIIQNTVKMRSERMQELLASVALKFPKII